MVTETTTKNRGEYRTTASWYRQGNEDQGRQQGEVKRSKIACTSIEKCQRFADGGS